MFLKEKFESDVSAKKALNRQNALKQRKGWYLDVPKYSFLSLLHFQIIFTRFVKMIKYININTILIFQVMQSTLK